MNLKIFIKIKRQSVNFWSNGFTLVEAMLGLAAFCMMAAFLPLSIQVIDRENDSVTRLQAMEWEIFSSQVKKEIRMSEKIDAMSNRLLLTKDSDLISYEQYGTKLRRRVNGTGNEVLLQNVNQVQFEKMKNGVLIKVEDIWNKSYSFSVQAFIQIGN
ncbi:competence type IV pilus minor pilin ComGF [Neobacillus sp. D3-1R]|uniref:competence type IV pilus minor pilin ComGF n=1 Tax=Neobacillus sp. D3-1R TaxID=3445778 RepID=UPI003F9EFA05